jgi:hypothetical protein
MKQAIHLAKVASISNFGYVRLTDVVMLRHVVGNHDRGVGGVVGNLEV